MEIFYLLDSVDSTNNYAMAKLHAGLAKHGQAWFAKDQHAGKGQRGKKWTSLPGQNILLSLVIEPAAAFLRHPFLFNAQVSLGCREFLQRYVRTEVKIKWPNDLYINDRKAGGILIENIYQGTAWKWAVVGIGININQVAFPDGLGQPTSIKRETNLDYDAIALARELHTLLLKNLESVSESGLQDILVHYNGHLFKRGERVRIRQQNKVFYTNITGVNEFGQLLTQDSMNRQFDFGEIEWLL